MSVFGTEVPLLDARLFGHDTVYTATANTNTDFYFNFPFDCKYNGTEIITDENVVLGDSISFITEYNAGPLGYKRYKKIAKCWHLKANDRARIILFPTEPTPLLRMKMQYKSVGTLNNVKFVVNFFTYVDEVNLDTSSLEEGEDW